MLSTSRRFLFLHVPKTGGNSIQDALRDCSDDRFVCLGPHHDGVERFELRSERFHTEKHSSLADYRAQYGPDLYEALFRFACVRNPWDRVLSFYFSPHRGEVRWSPADFQSFIPTVRPLREYLLLPGEAPTTLDRAASRVHHWLAFERLQPEFEALCQRLGLGPRPLPQRNRSAPDGGRNYRDYYDRHTRALVDGLFGDEAACFGYRF